MMALTPRKRQGNTMLFTQSTHFSKRNELRMEMLHILCTCMLCFISSQGIPELVVGSDECSYTFTWHSALACPVDIFNTNASEDVCSFRDPEGNSQFVFNSIASRKVSVPNSDNKFYIQLCGTATTAPKECGSNVGVCRSNGKYAETLVHASHKFVILSHAPHVFEVVYDTGETCTGDRDWSAVVTLVCKWRGGTAQPVFQSSTDCTLRFVWKNSLFCVGHEMCAAEDKAGGYTYDLDGLLSDTWSVRIYTVYLYALVQCITELVDHLQCMYMYIYKCI